MVISGLCGCVSVNIEEAPGGMMIGGQNMEVGGMSTPNSCVAMASNMLCTQCDSNGFLQVAVNDFDCPTFDCLPLTTYRSLFNSETQMQECRIRKYKEKTSRCSAVGVCHSSPEEFCIADQEQTIRDFDPRGCLGMQGCSGSEAPTDIIRVGETCEETGVCSEQGICENGQGPLNPMTGGSLGDMTGGMDSQDPCDQGFNWQYNSVNQQCGGVSNGNECEFFIVKEMNPWTSGEVSCNDFCTARGGRCISGYHNDGNRCGRGDSHSCNDSFNSSICLCSLP